MHRSFQPGPRAVRIPLAGAALDDHIQYPLHFLDAVPQQDNVALLRFARPESLSFRAGQWVHLGWPSGDRDRHRVHHMSFASAPGDDTLDFLMDLGTGSNYKGMMAALGPGDTVQAFKVRGDFTLPDSPVRVRFLAGGTGIAPIRSLLRDRALRRLPGIAELVHVSRNGHACRKDLEALDCPQYRVDRAGLDALWPRLRENARDMTWLVCGSDRFVEGMVHRLQADGVSPDRIVTEDFR